jgi:hypothetical protein
MKLKRIQTGQCIFGIEMHGDEQCYDHALRPAAASPSSRLLMQYPVEVVQRGVGTTPQEG